MAWNLQFYLHLLPMTLKNWEIIAETKQLSLKNAIPSKWINEKLAEDMAANGFLNTCEYLDTLISKKERTITDLPVVELQKALSLGELTALEVTQAYCHRAALAQQILNCCSEIFFDKAIDRAKELDEYFLVHKKPIGPLHGVPISLKDQVDLPGLDSAIGYVSKANKPMKGKSLLAETLESMGAVFYVKTTVPMAMMAPETQSNLLGYTKNALNWGLTSGGSSGGEGALIAAKASPLGFGTDLGGSIRIPASFHGLYALRPSFGRFSYLRVSNSYSGQGSIPSVIGPMARSLEDIEYITKLTFNAGLWKRDPKVLPIPYQKVSDLQPKLVVAVWKFDGKVMPHPPITRALNEVAESLKAAGHEVIEIDLPNHDKIMDVAIRTYTADEGKEVMKDCEESGEPVVPCVVPIVSKDQESEPLDVNTFWDLCNAAYECRQDFLEFWNNSGALSQSGREFDAIICPIWPSVSFKPGFEAIMNYSCPFNLLDCSSVVLPITKITREKDPKRAGYQPVNDLDQRVHDAYDPEVFEGLTACIQVVGQKLQDEKTLSVASVIDKIISVKSE